MSGCEFKRAQRNEDDAAQAKCCRDQRQTEDAIAQRAPYESRQRERQRAGTFDPVADGLQRNDRQQRQDAAHGGGLAQMPNWLLACRPGQNNGQKHHVVQPFAAQPHGKGLPVRRPENGAQHRSSQQRGRQCAQTAAHKQQQGGGLALHEQSGMALPVHQRPGRAHTGHIGDAQQDRHIEPAACEQIGCDIGRRNRQHRARAQPVRAVQQKAQQQRVCGPDRREKSHGAPQYAQQGG